ncbi:MAG: hypothetical protein M3R49_02470 [Chloroflexota bacterium]|nr:hypothetical protein [Chloroflexota bacterium]
MARPPSGGPARPGPRARILLGWAAAAALVALIAFVVGRPSKDAGTPEPSPSGATTVPVVFGTALDAGSGEATQPTDRFAAGDLFAYSVRLAAPVGRDAVQVEVLHVDGDTLTVVQAAAAQAVSAESRVIAFSVPADALLKAFGEGEFVMRIYRDPGQAPVAEGRFRLIGAG